MKKQSLKDIDVLRKTAKDCLEKYSHFKENKEERKAQFYLEKHDDVISLIVELKQEKESK